MRVENAFRCSERVIICFPFFSHCSYKLQRGGRGNEETVVTFSHTQTRTHTDCPCYVLLLLATGGAQGPEGQFMLDSHRVRVWLSLLTCSVSCGMIGCLELDFAVMFFLNVNFCFLFN